MTTEPPTSAADRFLAMLRPRSKPPKHVTEDQAYVAMLWRQVRALEARTCENPELLTQVVALAQRLAEIPNVAIATSAEQYALDPHRAASIGECAKAMGVSRQAASQRRAIGDRIIAERLAAAGVVKFSEAARERAAIKAAAEFAAEAMPEYHGRHLRVVA